MNIFVKKNDMGLIRIDPNLEKYGVGKKPFSECKGLKPYIEQGLEWFVSDEVIDKSDLESRKQLYWENDPVSGKTIIKKDYDWVVRLMPDQLIKRKHIKRLEKKIDEELAKETPDPIKLVKLQRECDKCRERKAGNQNEDSYWIETALKNLDERMSGGESDKPEIRKKLQKKLNELKKGKND